MDARSSYGYVQHFVSWFTLRFSDSYLIVLQEETSDVKRQCYRHSNRYSDSLTVLDFDYLRSSSILQALLRTSYVIYQTRGRLSVSSGSKHRETDEFYFFEVFESEARVVDMPSQTRIKIQCNKASIVSV